MSGAGTLRYGDIVAVIDAARGAGVTRVGVITEGMRRGGRRRLSTVRGVWVLALALTAAACDRPAPPAVSVRQPSLDADDLAVMRALFDDLLRPRRPEGVRAQARFLVVDTTMAMCRRDPAMLGPQPGRCLDPGWVALVSEAAPAGMARTVAMRFPAWTATRLSISAPLGDDVTFVSATVIDSVVPSEMLRPYPPGSEIVTLSAPGYPAPRMAVVAFAAGTGFGAARVERQTDGRWRVAESVIRSVD